MDENCTFHASDLHMLGTHTLRLNAKLLLSVGFKHNKLYEKIKNQKLKDLI